MYEIKNASPNSQTISIIQADFKKKDISVRTNYDLEKVVIYRDWGHTQGQWNGLKKSYS